MPPKIKNIGASQITRVLLKGDGWIEIEPGSFKFGTLDFWYDLVPGIDPVHSGLNYLGFSFNSKVGNKSYCVPTDGIGAIEIQEG
jgi:hypothetical protein